MIVHRATHNFVILNRFPYTNGHLMVVPYRARRHAQGSWRRRRCRDDAPGARVEKHLRALYHPDGLNIGMNLGKSAGAGHRGHLHMHALPRWTGDANFMTVIGETRVLPEGLATTWERLSAAFRG